MSLRAPRGDVRVDVRGEARRRTEGPRDHMQREPPEIAQRFRTRTLFGCSRGPDCRSLPHPSAFPEYLIHSSRHRYHRASLYRTRYSYPGAPYITPSGRAGVVSSTRTHRPGPSTGPLQLHVRSPPAPPRPPPALRPRPPRAPRAAHSARARAPRPGPHTAGPARSRRDRHVGVHDEEVLSMQ